MKKGTVSFLAAVTASTLAALVQAGEVTGLARFNAGTPALASEVNSNFDAVASAVNDNHARLTTLESRLMGSSNTAVGAAALINNTTGISNTATGASALQANTEGFSNSGFGASALARNRTGIHNTAIGANALSNAEGNGNIAVGVSAGGRLTTGSGNIFIGNEGAEFESSTVRIGTIQAHERVFVAGIRGVTTEVANALAVMIDSNGQLGTVNSSRRVKDDIAEMGEASAVLMRLKPVTFHYKVDRRAQRTLQYGLIAEDVAKVAPGLVARSATGEIESVYYQFLAPMLLNEYQKQQRTIEAQARQLDTQAARIAVLERQSADVLALRQEILRINSRLLQFDAAPAKLAAK